MVGIRFGGARDEILTLMQRLGVITPPYLSDLMMAAHVWLPEYIIGTTIIDIL